MWVGPLCVTVTLAAGHWSSAKVKPLNISSTLHSECKHASQKGGLLAVGEVGGSLRLPQL